MMKIAQRIAENTEECFGLVTGESIGQVASQTMKSLYCTDDAVTIPVYRPLIGNDKQEIIDGRQQFVVRLEPRGNWEYALYHGHLYIDCETLAFTRADLSLDMSDREKATRLMLIRKPSGVRFRPRELSTLIDYRQEGGVTRVSYIRNVFRFNCDWKRRLFATSFAATCEMVVHRADGAGSSEGTDVQGSTRP